MGPCAGYPGFLGVFSLRADSVRVRLRDTTCCSPSASDVEVSKRVPSLPVVVFSRARARSIAIARVGDWAGLVCLTLTNPRASLMEYY